MHIRVAHEEEAGVIGRMQPFVKVEGDTVGPLQPLDQRLELGRKRRQRAESEYGIVPNIEKHMRLYTELLQKKAPSRQLLPSAQQV